MDPIHPILPASVRPAPVDPLRRVARTGDDARNEQHQPRRPRPRKPAPAPPPPAVTGDGHVDALA